MAASREVASCSGIAITSSVSAASRSAGSHDRRYPRNDEKNTTAGGNGTARPLTLANMTLIIVDQMSAPGTGIPTNQSKPAERQLHHKCAQDDACAPSSAGSSGAVGERPPTRGKE